MGRNEILGEKKRTINVSSEQEQEQDCIFFLQSAPILKFIKKRIKTQVKQENTTTIQLLD